MAEMNQVAVVTVRESQIEPLTANQLLPVRALAGGNPEGASTPPQIRTAQVAVDQRSVDHLTMAPVEHDDSSSKPRGLSDACIPA
jgi:hypothetical protein